MSDSSKEKILLVEDNPDDVFLICRVFAKEGLEDSVDVVGDGKSAIQYFEEQIKLAGNRRPAKPELVFLDLKLPHLNGFDVLSWIRQQPSLRSLPVCILTSSLEDRDRNRAQEFGVPFLVKPPTVEMVRQALELARKNQSAGPQA